MANSVLIVCGISAIIGAIIFYFIGIQMTPLGVGGWADVWSLMVGFAGIGMLIVGLSKKKSEPST